MPQLKLPLETQPSLGAAPRLPLAAVHRLAGPGAVDASESRPLPAREAALALVRHTVASRLPPSGLLARHLAFWARAAEAVPVRARSYPFRRDSLPRVRELIAADLTLSS